MNTNNVATKIKWTATAITLAGAVLASVNIYPLSAVTLNLGSFVFLIWSVMIRDRAMITVNGGLLAIYTVGLAIKLL
jgi:hypothetical protein